MSRESKPIEVQKFGRKQVPPGLSVNTLVYKGEPAKTQGEFTGGVGIADMACVNQFGEHNNAKYYHAGVVQSPDGRWFTYYEWGRMKGGGKSWNGAFNGGDFQFIEWADERSARTAFAKQCKSKNIGRLEQKTIGGVLVWAAKTDKSGQVKDGYIIQSLATRERGLPDAYTIKDSAGVAATGGNGTKKVVKRVKCSSSFQPQVIKLATDLVGGVKTYARAQAAATGIVPTQDAIDRVRDQLIPVALQRIASVGDSIDAQINDPDLIAISKLVRGMVPMPIPTGRMSVDARAKAAILSSGNILALQADLDAFEAALLNEDWDETVKTGTNPNQLLNATLSWLDPRSELGRWVTEAITNMTRNRHSYYSRPIQIKNVFNVSRPDRDARFVAAARRVAAQNCNKQLKHFARLQPRRRSDLGDLADVAPKANIFLGIHGTRAVNVGPIIQTDLRLPKHLPGARITGAAFGSGIYHAVDYFKSANYLGNSSSYWTAGGQLNTRPQSSFFFLCDVIMGDAYMTPSTGSWNKPPNGKDSVAAYPEFCRSLVNEEHIIFDPTYQRIRYIVEVKSW